MREGEGPGLEAPFVGGDFFVGLKPHANPKCNPSEQRPLAGDPGDCEGWGTRAFCKVTADPCGMTIKKHATATAKAKCGGLSAALLTMRL